MDNPNLLYALASHPVKIGTARETFVVNQLACDHEIEYGKKTGDFRVNGKYTLEVMKETYNQIAMPDSYILADGIETPYRCKLPIWVVGFHISLDPSRRVFLISSFIPRKLKQS